MIKSSIFFIELVKPGDNACKESLTATDTTIGYEVVKVTEDNVIRINDHLRSIGCRKDLIMVSGTDVYLHEHIIPSSMSKFNDLYGYNDFVRGYANGAYPNRFGYTVHWMYTYSIKVAHRAKQNVIVTG
jgi:hypothetical protein